MLTLFVMSVVVMCALTTALAVLTVIADATIGRYGPARIDLNGRRRLTVEGGKPLLATLKDEGIFVPSACGGRGSCGLCKLQLLEGGGDPLPTETPWLDAAEKAAHVRLACQVKVKRDLRIVIPEELLSVRQYATQVAGLRDLTHDIKEVRLRLVNPPEIEFVPGQFVQFEVPPYRLTDEPVYRAYSLASDRRRRNEIELEIRYVPSGLCTTYVHQHLRVGDLVTINGPYGDFRLRDSDREIILIAGGSGMAPIKSILADMAHARSPRRTRYFFGAKAVRDLFLVDELKALESLLPDFRFIPALSAPLPGDVWSGERGLVTEVVDRHYERCENMEAYLCGSPLMIDACIEVLKRKGLPELQIFYDKFA